MAKIGSIRRVAIEVSGGETVVFICRIPTGEEHSQFLNSRFATRRNKVESRVYDARAEFVDKITTDIEGATFDDANGEEVTLNAATVLTDADKSKWSGLLGKPVKNFRDLIPLSWKSSAAQQFEDSSNAGDDAKN